MPDHGAIVVIGFGLVLAGMLLFAWALCRAAAMGDTMRRPTRQLHPLRHKTVHVEAEDETSAWTAIERAS